MPTSPQTHAEIQQISTQVTTLSNTLQRIQVATPSSSSAPARIERSLYPKFPKHLHSHRLASLSQHRMQGAKFACGSTGPKKGILAA